MTDSTMIFNFSSLITFVQNILMILGGFTLTGIVLFLVYSHKNIHIFVNQNNKLIDKFPLVSPDFFRKNTKEQNIENNQEIHEINKKFEKLEELVEKVIENANRT